MSFTRLFKSIDDEILEKFNVESVCEYYYFNDKNEKKQLSDLFKRFLLCLGFTLGFITIVANGTFLVKDANKQRELNNSKEIELKMNHINNAENDSIEAFQK